MEGKVFICLWLLLPLHTLLSYVQPQLSSLLRELIVLVLLFSYRSTLTRPEVCTLLFEIVLYSFSGARCSLLDNRPSPRLHYKLSWLSLDVT